MNNLFKYNQDWESGKIKEQYMNLYDDLIDGKIRNNDDIRILKYECAIRKCQEELNQIIPFNGCPLKETNKELVMAIEKCGIPVLTQKIYDDEEIDFIELSQLELDYSFFKKIEISDDYNEYLQDKLLGTPSTLKKNIIESVSTLKKNIIKSGRVNLIKVNPSFTINSDTKDIKGFLDTYFSDVLAAKTIDTRKDNIEKIVDMFLYYDQIQYYGKTKNYNFIFQQKKRDKRTLNKWFKKISEAISSYQTYL